MKRIHIILFILIIASIGLLVSASDEVSTYGSFDEARISGDRMKITGTLVKNKPIVYDPLNDANYFSFYLKDNNGVIEQVVMYRAKPQDFELSEQLVLTGKFKEGSFYASDMLMKCPSKYVDQEAYLRKEK